MYKISKMVWASKTALATILLGFLFVGGASLRAQEGSKNGWFVSASPLIFGASKIETKTTITASGGGEVTVGDLTADIRSSFATDALDNASQNLTNRDLCAGTLVGATVDIVISHTNAAPLQQCLQNRSQSFLTPIPFLKFCT